MAEFHSITREEMAFCLEGQGFRQITLPNVTELVWGKRVDRGGQALSLDLSYQCEGPAVNAPN